MGSGLYLAFDKKAILAVVGLFGESELAQSSEGRRFWVTGSPLSFFW